MKPPKVSVIMPAYNAERFLESSIASVQAQTLADFELIVVDDGSNDSTAAIVERMAASDSRIRLVKHAQNGGIVAALNTALDNATAPFIARMDADDICLPKRLEKQLDFLEKHADVCAVFCLAQFMDEAGNDMPHNWPEDESTRTWQDICQRMPKGNCLVHPSLLIRAEILKHYRFRKERSAQGYSAEDYNLWLRLCADNQRLEKLPEYLLRYRVFADNLTHSQKENPRLRSMRAQWDFLRNRKLSGYNRFTRRTAMNFLNGLYRVFLRDQFLRGKKPGKW